MEYSVESFEEEDESQIDLTWGGRDGLIFLIDCSKKMFDEGKFAESIEIVEATMLNRVIRSERDLLGIVFYNIQNSPPPINESELDGGVTTTDNVAILLHIKSISADSIKYIRRFKENDFEDFTIKFGHCETNSDCLNNAFWICAKMFKTCGYKLQESSVLLLTNNSIPFQRGSIEERSAFKKADDLRDSGVGVVLVPMSNNFATDQFYKQFLCIVNDIDEETVDRDLENPEQQREKLLIRIFRKDFRKRCNQRVKFCFGQDLAMSVGLYSMYRLAKPPKRVTLLRDTNEMIETKRVTMVAERNETNEVDRKILPSEEKKYQEFGNGEKVIFTKQEYQAMKRIKEPGIILLGFKPKSSFVVENHLRGPIFMYPDETNISGSTTLFTALWKKCIEMEKIVYAIMTERYDANPKIVILVPQKGNYNRADGFRVEFIPYAESIREIEVTAELQTVEDQTVDIFKKLIRKLKFKYSPALFNNPVVRIKYDCIEAQIFETDIPEQFDNTLPDFNTQDQKIGDLVEQFKDLFGEDNKRKQTTQGSDRPAKRPKMSVEDAYQANNLNDLTVQDLKDFLASKGLKSLSKLKKDQLIEEVKKLLD